jgi:hypothetical protein
MGAGPVANKTTLSGNAGAFGGTGGGIYNNNNATVTVVKARSATTMRALEGSPRRDLQLGSGTVNVINSISAATALVGGGRSTKARGH